MIMSTIKKYVYNWECHNMNASSGSCSNNVDSCDDEFRRMFVNINDSTWKGKSETLSCLKSIMNLVHKYTFLVVAGYVQSGKSSLLLYYSYWMCKKHDMNVVIILRNYNEDAFSLKTKFDNFKKDKNLRTRDLEVVLFSDYNERVYKSDYIDKMRDSNKIFILLGNADQLKKLNDLIKECDKELKPFVVCIDEFDLNDKTELTLFQKEFDELKNCGFVSNVLGVTGTCLPTMFKKIDILTNEQVIRLGAPINYKGIHNISFTKIDINDENIVRNTMLRMLDTQYAFYANKNMDQTHPLLLKMYFRDITFFAPN